MTPCTAVMGGMLENLCSLEVLPHCSVCTVSLYLTYRDTLLQGSALHCPYSILHSTTALFPNWTQVERTFSGANFESFHSKIFSETVQ